MNLLKSLTSLVRKDPQPLGMDRPERKLSPEDISLLKEIQARLSGIGEPPQLGNLVTLTDIQRAIQMARLGEVYFKNALHRDMIINDPHLQAMIGQRVMSFMGQNETIEPLDPNNPDDVMACEFIEDIQENCENWREGCGHLALGHIWSVSGVEKIFARVEPEDSFKYRHRTTFMLRKLHPIPWPLFTYRVAYWNVNMAGGAPGDGMVPQALFTNSGAMPMQDVTGRSALQPLPNENEALVWNPNDWHPDLRFYNTYPNGMVDWSMSTCYKPDKNRHVLHSAHIATNGFRENMAGVLDSLIPIWFYKKNLIDWYMSKMERYGGPFAVATARMSDKNTSDLLTKAFNQATKINALLVPPGTKIELKEIQVSGMSDGFAKGIDLLNMEETKAICGQTMSTSDKGNGMSGGSGKAELQGEVKEEWTHYDKQAFCNMKVSQIYHPILRLNGYRGRIKSMHRGMSMSNMRLLAQTFQSFYLSGIRLKKEDEPKISIDTGYKLEVFDPQAEAAAAETNKATADRKD